ncbi:hypothetical protein K438DRAFT_1630388 [Mycena galopus ATCC 62051]|nr:hypothetical protein K438DRAFT_1630388 [Mycena galopus ATCC 62051]
MSKLQIGSPVACMYLLGYPDHYTNLTFKACWWKSYVAYVCKDWPETLGVKPVELEQDSIPEHEAEDEADHAVLMRSKNGYVGATAVDDYGHRPREYEHCNIFEYIQVSARCKRTPKELQQFAENISETANFSGV